MVAPQNWFYYITPHGDEVLLNDHTNTFFLEEDGFGLDAVEVISERAAYEHGVIPISVYLPEREILLRIGIMSTDDASWRTIDDNLCRECSPFIEEETPGTLRRVRADGSVRDIDAYLTNYTKSSQDRQGPVYGERVLKFFCPDPFFYDPTQVEVNYALGNMEGFTFPLTYPFTFPATLLNETADVYNPGDAKTWPHIYCYGPMTNPTVENETTGHTISITKVLDAGDYINIDMEDCTVYFYDFSLGTTTSITELMTTTSTFWYLKRGSNTVHFTAQGVVNGGIIFKFYRRYQSI